MMEGPPSSRETADAVREAVPSSAAASTPANDVAATSAHADQASKRGKTYCEQPGTERGVSSRLPWGGCTISEYMRQVEVCGAPTGNKGAHPGHCEG